MYSESYGAVFFGLSAFMVRVETDVGSGLPCFEMSGYLTNEVKEAKERVKVAIKNSGYDLRPQRIVINYSPADLRKQGTGLDLPTAMGVLAANSMAEIHHFNKTVFIGELGFDGSLREVRGCLPCLMKARMEGFKNAVVPVGNSEECNFVKGLNIYPVKDLKEAVLLMSLKSLPEPIKNITHEKEHDLSSLEDFNDIKGQTDVKKATLVAAAGMHNILYIGSPGSGKSMFAKRIPSIMPPLSYEEQMELTKIYSIAGKLKEEKGLINKRPFRSPGQNITESALLGGGSSPDPGEITLASKGVLFLDELTQYKMHIIEALRQPLEDKRITVSRNRYSITYPADFMLVGAVNPCKCGFYPDRLRCHCSDLDIERYMGRISGPMLDRFDIRIHTAPVSFSDMFTTYPASGNAGNSPDDHTDMQVMTSTEMREKVCVAHEIQQKRFKEHGHRFNSEMTEGEIKEFCKLKQNELHFLEAVFERFHLTARGCKKILKTARTAADLDLSEDIKKKHIAMAVNFRNDGRIF